MQYDYKYNQDRLYRKFFYLIDTLKHHNRDDRKLCLIIIIICSKVRKLFTLFCLNWQTCMLKRG